MLNPKHSTTLLLLLASGCPGEVGGLSTTDAPSTTQPTTSSGADPGQQPTDDGVAPSSSSAPEGTSTTSTSSSTTDELELTTAQSTSTTDSPMTYSVTVIVGGLGDDSTTLKLGDQELAVDGDGPYIFPDQLIDGAAYQVEFAEPPADHHCTLDDPSGFVDGMDVVVAAACLPIDPKDLLLAEIGLADHSGDSFWIELAHVGDVAIDLADYSVRARSFDTASLKTSIQTYPLASRILAPGDRVLLRGAIADVFPGPQIVPISHDATTRPYFVGFGAVELLRGAESRDYVAFGPIAPNQAATLAPTSPEAWSGYPADTAALPDKGLTMRGKSIARDLELHDTNTSADWTPVVYSTPGGRNDTHGCTADLDADGLPDCSEAIGASYAGVDVYGLGARPAQRDIFMEIDYMDPKGKDGVTVDPGMVPYMVALARVVEVFAAHQFHLHLDTGPLFDPAPGLNLANFDRGGGEQIEYAPRICFGTDPACTSIDAIKAGHMAAQRLSMFHYLVFGDMALIEGAGGQGERPGNDIYLSLGSRGFSLASEKQANRTYINQAASLMHELGHNLGLSHGGYSVHKGDAKVDEANNKPNYLSIMNYLYDSYGLPQIGVQEGDRYYYQYAPVDPACKAKGVTYSTMKPPANGPIADLIIDFSSGLGSTIDLAAVDESAGLGQVGSQWVDFDCDGIVDPPYAHDLHVAVDFNDQFVITEIRDHDDWGDLDLYFLATRSGFDNTTRAHAPAPTRRSGLRAPLIRAPIVNDAQPLEPPDLLPPRNP